ncbi:MAG: hypothetical protein QW404_02065 [Candidatus Nanoarchaeia archaeon]
MSEFDYVIKDMKVAQESTFDMQELYRLGRTWFDKHGYDFYEKEYIASQKEDSKNASIKWEAEKKIDDYIKVHIEARVKFKNLREVQGKKKMMNTGEVSVNVESYIERDYESNWEKGFMTKFIRGLYDTFLIRGKIDKDKNRLERETKEFLNEIRTFLKVNPVR